MLVRDRSVGVPVSKLLSNPTTKKFPLPIAGTCIVQVRASFVPEPLGHPTVRKGYPEGVICLICHKEDDGTVRSSITFPVHRSEPLSVAEQVPTPGLA